MRTYHMYITQNQYVVIILIYVASRRVRSIVIIEKQSTQQRNTCDDGPSTSTYDQPTTNPPSCRARPWNIEGGLEDTMWIRRLGGERLLATRGCSRMF